MPINEMRVTVPIAKICDDLQGSLKNVRREFDRSVRPILSNVVDISLRAIPVPMALVGAIIFSDPSPVFAQGGKDCAAQSTPLNVPRIIEGCENIQDVTGVAMLCLAVVGVGVATTLIGRRIRRKDQDGDPLRAQWEYHQANAVPDANVSEEEWRVKMDSAASKLPNLPAPGTPAWIKYMAQYWGVDEDDISKNGW